VGEPARNRRPRPRRAAGPPPGQGPRDQPADRPKAPDVTSLVVQSRSHAQCPTVAGRIGPSQNLPTDTRSYAHQPRRLSVVDSRRLRSHAGRTSGSLARTGGEFPVSSSQGYRAGTLPEPAGHLDSRASPAVRKKSDAPSARPVPPSRPPNQGGRTYHTQTNKPSPGHGGRCRREVGSAFGTGAGPGRPEPAGRGRRP